MRSKIASIIFQPEGLLHNSNCLSNTCRKELNNYETEGIVEVLQEQRTDRIILKWSKSCFNPRKNPSCSSIFYLASEALIFSTQLIVSLGVKTAGILN